MLNIGYKIRIELILCIIFFIIPVILPLLSNEFMPSLSEYVNTSQKWTYNILLSIIGLLMMLDGFLYQTRKYNILIGVSMMGVVLVPITVCIPLHNLCAVIFFVGNAFIVTYYSKLLNYKIKALFSAIILITLALLISGIINLYIAEAIGMFSMSYFMYIRYSILELKRKASIV